MRYGIYDTTDNVWLGDDKGPWTYGEGDVVNNMTMTDAHARAFARVRSEVIAYQMKYRHDRLEIRPIPDNIWLRKKERGTIP